jgi:hypothetical protein
MYSFSGIAFLFYESSSIRDQIDPEGLSSHGRRPAVCAGFRPRPGPIHRLLPPKRHRA